MDESQSNHLKAYGISYWTLENGITIEWLLNYRGGSFLYPNLQTIQDELSIRGVKYQILTIFSVLLRTSTPCCIRKYRRSINIQFSASLLPSLL